MPNEPSMEEILSSIKRVIADEDRTVAPRAPRRGGSTPAGPRVVASEPGHDLSGHDLPDLSADDSILELTDVLPDESPSPNSPSPKVTAKPAPVAAKPAASASPPASPSASPKGGAAVPDEAAMKAAVLSEISARAARESLDNLSRLLVRSDDGQSNTLEGLVREMLRPMLKDWLDTNLPPLVETMVKREIDRITGRV